MLIQEKQAKHVHLVLVNFQERCGLVNDRPDSIRGPVINLGLVIDHFLVIGSLFSNLFSCLDLMYIVLPQKLI